MSVRTTLGGTLAVGALVFAAVQYNSWRSQQSPKAGTASRDVPVLLVATWQSNRDMQLSWTANGAHPPPEVDPLSPWEKEIQARPGSTVTFTVRPLIGGPGNHHCQIEYPPGTPLQGHAQKTGGGTTPITCTAVIGA